MTWGNKNPTPVTVAALITHLQTFPQDSVVLYQIYSEQKLLELDEVMLAKLQPWRPDGWVAGGWGHGSEHLRTQTYVVFPGN